MLTVRQYISDELYVSSHIIRFTTISESQHNLCYQPSLLSHRCLLYPWQKLNIFLIRYTKLNYTFSMLYGNPVKLHFKCCRRLSVRLTAPYGTGGEHTNSKYAQKTQKLALKFSRAEVTSVPTYSWNSPRCQKKTTKKWRTLTFHKSCRHLCWRFEEGSMSCNYQNVSNNKSL